MRAFAIRIQTIQCVLRIRNEKKIKKNKILWKMATEHIEFDEDVKKMKKHQKVK